MCDTLVLRRGALTYFAKNSDREPNEPQHVVYVPGRWGDRTSRVRTTHRIIPQTANRHAMILSMPYGIWGAEMGVNDYGVVIGNEAVFTNVHDPTPGLIGMDLVRLGLERGDTARHALHVITEHLERYGQGGPAVYRSSFSYDNAFLIADAEEAWVLETARRVWAARRVDTHAAISNRLTIRTEFDLHADGLHDFARKHGRFDGRGDLDFAAAFEARFLTYFSRSRERLEAGRACLRAAAARPSVGLADMIAHLRSHARRDHRPRTGTNADVCMHAGGFIRRSQTTASMVVRLGGASEAVFVTGTAAPCLSLFKPVSFYGKSYVFMPPRANTTDGLWLRRERGHRHLLLAGPDERAAFRADRDAVERVILASFEDPDRKFRLPDYGVVEAEARAWEERWIARFEKEPFRYRPLDPYHRFWRRQNRRIRFR